jgi:hypothetical protein
VDRPLLAGDLPDAVGTPARRSRSTTSGRVRGLVLGTVLRRPFARLIPVSLAGAHQSSVDAPGHSVALPVQLGVDPAGLAAGPCNGTHVEGRAGPVQPTA